MATGTLPDAGQILNALINSILLVDDELAVHYANPAAQQLLAQSSRKLYGTPLPELLSYFSLNISLMQESLNAGQGFTDNEVTLVIDGRSHILSLTAQRLPDGLILLEMAPMDNQRRLSQEQLQHAQQVAARDLVRGLAHEIKNPLGGLRGAAQLLSRALPDPSLTEYTKVIIEQADRLRNLVDRLLGPQQPGMHVTESIHKVAERVVKLVSMELPENVRLLRDYDPSLPEFTHDPDQIEQVLLNIVRNALQALGEDGGFYNVNADMVAGHIAAAIGAHKVVFLTDVDGLYENFENKDSLISNLTLFEAQYMVENNIVSTGMIPKLKSCIHALDSGVFRAHIINGITPHSLLLELLTSTGVGTTMHSTEESCTFDTHPLGNFASKLLENRQHAVSAMPNNKIF